MAILVDKATRLLVQGITGRDGSFHTRQMKEYGTKVVAGVTPGKGGKKFDGVPVFNTVSEAVNKTGANTSVIYVPALYAADAIFEAIDSLPANYRDVILYRHKEEKSYEEIAVMLGIPVGTVKARIFRGRELLKKKLKAWRKKNVI